MNCQPERVSPQLGPQMNVLLATGISDAGQNLDTQISSKDVQVFINNSIPGIILTHKSTRTNNVQASSLMHRNGITPREAGH